MQREKKIIVMAIHYYYITGLNWEILVQLSEKSSFPNETISDECNEYNTVLKLFNPSKYDGYQVGLIEKINDQPIAVSDDSNLNIYGFLLPTGKFVLENVVKSNLTILNIKQANSKYPLDEISKIGLQELQKFLRKKVF